MADNIADLIASLVIKLEKLESKLESTTERVRVLEGKRPPAGKKNIDAYDQKVINMVKGLISDWPKTRGPEKTPIRNNIVDAVSRVTMILNEYTINLEELEASTREWLATNPEYANAVQFYFGVGRDGKKPRWQIELEGYKTRRR